MVEVSVWFAADYVDFVVYYVGLDPFLGCGHVCFGCPCVGCWVVDFGCVEVIAVVVGVSSSEAVDFVLVDCCGK